MKDLNKSLQQEEKFIIPLLSTMEILFGKNNLMKFSKEYILNFLIKRGVLSESKERLKQELISYTNFEKKEITRLVNSYFRIRKTLPEISKEINSKLNKLNKQNEIEINNHILENFKDLNNNDKLDLIELIEHEDLLSLLLKEINYKDKDIIDVKDIPQLTDKEMEKIFKELEYATGEITLDGIFKY